MIVCFLAIGVVSIALLFRKSATVISFGVCLVPILFIFPILAEVREITVIGNMLVLKDWIGRKTRIPVGSVVHISGVGNSSEIRTRNTTYRFSEFDGWSDLVEFLNGQHPESSERSQNAGESYELVLPLFPSILTFIVPLALLAIGINLLIEPGEHSLIARPLIVCWLGFCLRIAFSFWNGPRKIKVSGEIVQFKNWFGRTVSMPLRAIHVIDCGGTALAMECEAGKFITSNQFNDVQRFVSDVKKSNPAVLLKGL